MKCNYPENEYRGRGNLGVVLEHDFGREVYLLKVTRNGYQCPGLILSEVQLETLHSALSAFLSRDGLTKCPCDPSTKCRMTEPCVGCETYSAWLRADQSEGGEG